MIFIITQADLFSKRLAIDPIATYRYRTCQLKIHRPNIGIKTGADLKKVSLDDLIHCFGKVGSYYYHVAHGRENRPVQPDRERKSYGKETTLDTDIDDTNQMMSLRACVGRIARA